LGSCGFSMILLAMGFRSGRQVRRHLDLSVRVARAALGNFTSEGVVIRRTIRLFLVALAAAQTNAGILATAQEKTIIRDRPSAAVPAEPPKLILETGGSIGAITALAFSADGRSLAVGATDKTVRIWDLEKGELRATLRGQQGAGGIGTIDALAFSPDSHWLVVGVHATDEDIGAAPIRVYDLADPSRIQAVLGEHQEPVITFLAFSRDGKYLASASLDNEIVVWDWAKRRPRDRRRPFKDLSRNILYMDFPLDRPHLIVGNGANWYGWSVEDGRATDGDDWKAFTSCNDAFNKRITLPDGARGARGVLYRPNPGLVFAFGLGHRDGRDTYWANGWSSQTDRELVAYRGHSVEIKQLALSPDGSTAASGDIWGEVHVWDVATAQVRHIFRSQGRPIYKVAFDATGRRLAFGTCPLSPGRWNYNNYAELERTFDLDGRRILDGAPGQHQVELTRLGDRSLSLAYVGNDFTIRSDRGGRMESRYTLWRNYSPHCFSFLQSRAPGFPDPIVIDEGGFVVCLDPRTMMKRQEFVGHSGIILTLSNCRFVVSEAHQ
jgi:WD40 repeat protein